MHNRPRVQQARWLKSQQEEDYRVNHSMLRFAYPTLDSTRGQRQNVAGAENNIGK